MHFGFPLTLLPRCCAIATPSAALAPVAPNGDNAPPQVASEQAALSGRNFGMTCATAFQRNQDYGPDATGQANEAGAPDRLKMDEGIARLIQHLREESKTREPYLFGVEQT